MVQNCEIAVVNQKQIYFAANRIRGIGGNNTKIKIRRFFPFDDYSFGFFNFSCCCNLLLNRRSYHFFGPNIQLRIAGIQQLYNGIWNFETIVVLNHYHIFIQKTGYNSTANIAQKLYFIPYLYHVEIFCAKVQH